MNDSEGQKNSGNDPELRQYASPAEGQKQLAVRYEYWTAKITDHSFQACLALIGANWAIHGSEGLKQNPFAIASVVAALATMLSSLLGALCMAKLHYAAFYEAEKDRNNWKRRWESSERIDSEWPFNHAIVSCGRLLPRLKAWIPVLGGLFLVAGVWLF